MKITGAIVGAGAMAREHLVAMNKVADGEIAAVCDLSPVRAEMTAERYSIGQRFTDLEAMLEATRPNIVHITAPPKAHFALAKRCLERDIHVLCEKPITDRYSDFVILRDMARERDLTLLENQNYRFHSSVLRMIQLRDKDALGEIVDVQASVHLDVLASGSPIIDRNAPHWSLDLKGGVVGDFLTHMVYLAQIFAGELSDLRTWWRKRVPDSPLPSDEFRALAIGSNAPVGLSFSAGAQPNGFWLRVAGTRMHVEANLFEPPRLAVRRRRDGAPPLSTFFDSLAEARMIAGSAVDGLVRKIAGTARYDGLAGFLGASYASLARGESQPITLEEIDQTARAVDALTRPENRL